jgi:hypothetical protein
LSVLNNKQIYIRYLGVFILFLTLLNVQASLQPAKAADPPLTFKWRVSPFSATDVGAVAGDLNGDGVYDVVATGAGHCAAIDGKTGTIMWDYANSAITKHYPAEIADINNDGQNEVIISTYNPTVLRGSTGQVLWTNTGTLAYENYLATFDINGDGYQEVFATSGTAFNTSYDYLSKMSYDGNLINQASAWHTCYGGLTVADANFDGQFELYVADRSVGYSAGGDIYTGGGMGIKALDANTLQPLWNDASILCSSQIPMLADVNKDGKLEIIVADQSNSGIAVYNAADGSVDTVGGKYRKGNVGIKAHSQPTIYDIDGDGNLEFISCRAPGSQVMIWDLYDWKLDATLMNTTDPLNPTVLWASEPPKVGDVNGDGKMEIIAMGLGATNHNVTTGIFLYQYNSVTNNYDQIFYLPNTGNLHGDQKLNNFTCLQDVDGDGLNELIVTSGWGWVYCFDTPSVTPSPKVRSEIQFYSEYRLGVAEYVAPPTPTKPVVTESQPLDNSVNQGSNPVLSVRVTSWQKLNMNIQFATNSSGSWQLVGSQFSGVPSGVYSVTTSNMNVAGRKYYWRVTATETSDGLDSTQKTFSFTTSSGPPTQAGPRLQSSTGDLVASNQTTTDPNGDKVVNVYNWKVNGLSTTGLNLPFETRASGNLLSSDSLFSDSLSNFDKWNDNGVTNWDISTAQSHSGPSSAHATLGDTYLSSDRIDASAAQGITISFWYRDHGLATGNVVLQFWNGTSYTPMVWKGGSVSQGFPKWVQRPSIFNLGTTTPEDTWQYFSIETNEQKFLRSDFSLRFALSGMTSGKDVWIDDVSVTTFTQTKDYSGNDNDATVNGATWTSSGVVGGAYVFDGKNDYMRIGDDPSLGGDGSWSQISLEFWIKPTASQTGTYIMAKRDPIVATGSYMVGFRDSGTPNTLFFGVSNGIVDTRGRLVRTDLYNDQTVLPVNKWSHVVATYLSGTGMSIYINGTLRASLALSGNIAAIPPGGSVQKAPLYIGYDGASSQSSAADGGSYRYRWLSATLDEVRVYNRALTESQAVQRFTDTRLGSSGSSKMKAAEMSNGQTWTVDVTPNDSFGNGATQSASAQTPSTTQYNLIISVSGDHGTTSPVPGTSSYYQGSIVSVSALPNLGYQLDHWTLNGNNMDAVNPLQITINGPQNLVAYFSVAPTGFLRVTTSPALPSTILVDGVPRNDWGIDWAKMTPGTYTISYTDVPGYKTPDPQTLTVNSGETTTATGIYSQLGYLRVITDPALPATVYLDGHPLNDWGAWLSLTPGQYTVSFGAVEGYSIPSDQVVIVSTGGTTVATGSYVSGESTPPTGYGYLRVVTNPPVQGTIYVDGLPSNDWGLDWAKYPPGQHVASFSGVPGYQTPAPRTVTVSQGGTTVVTGNYVSLGYLHVATSPPSQSTIYVNGVAMNDWGCWVSLPAGAYTVSWGPVPGGVGGVPDPQLSAVTAGSTTTVTGTFP